MQTPKSGLFATVFSALLSPLIKSLDRPAQPRYHGEISLKGLQRAVHVGFDRYAVPHAIQRFWPNCMHGNPGIEAPQLS